MRGAVPVADGPVPACALGAEIGVTRQRCAVGKAYRAEGRVTVEVVYFGPPAGAAAFIAGLYAADDPVAVALDPKSQSATLLRPLAELGVLVTRLSAEDVAVAHGEFTDLVTANGLRHLNQEELTAAVRGAQQRALAGAQAWERRVQAEQCPLNACTFAAWALLRYEELSSPGAWAM
jgi:hypothetical protein